MVLISQYLIIECQNILTFTTTSNFIIVLLERGGEHDV